MAATLATPSLMIIERLRAELIRRRLAGCIVTSADPHNSEYVADVFKRRERLCGFAGSCGTCVVTAQMALLWTDARYWLEASQSLSSGWTLMRDRPGVQGNVTIEDYLKAHFKGREADAAVIEGDAVAVDGRTVTRAQWTQWTKAGLRLVDTGDANLVDVCSRAASEEKQNGTDIAACFSCVPPRDPVTLHPSSFHGESTNDKLQRLRAGLCEEHRDGNVNAFLLTALDDVAWLLNLRGSDVPYCPVFYGYLLVDFRTCKSHDVANDAALTLFVDSAKVQDVAVAAYLADHRVQVKPYEDAVSALGAIGQEEAAGAAAMIIAINEAQSSHAVMSALESNRALTVVRGRAQVQWMKAVKNTVQLQSVRDAHVIDGAALVAFLSWVEAEVVVKGARITEFEAAESLLDFRRRYGGETFRGASFETIAGTGANGAIIHYRPSASQSAILTRDQLLLVDSGGQYLGGTTDVTRTVHFDVPTEAEREAYTAVLKGHIALNSAVFPLGTSGHRLDCLARLPLWRLGLDYNHGTGHGVGLFLNVHEGPHGIGVNPIASGATLAPGMLVSNEPGYYKDGAFGIRIENIDEVVVASPANTQQLPSASGTHDGKPFLTLRAVTLAPYCRRLIQLDALNPATEVPWIDKYHARVRVALAPIVADNALALEYLLRETSPLRSEAP